MEHPIGKVIDYNGDKFLVEELPGPFSCGKCHFDFGRMCLFGRTPCTREEKKEWLNIFGECRWGRSDHKSVCFVRVPTVTNN